MKLNYLIFMGLKFFRETVFSSFVLILQIRKSIKFI